MSVLQFIIILLTTTLVLFYLKFRWNRRHLYRLADKIQGSNGLPFLGVALSFLGKSSQEIFKELLSITWKFPTPSKFWLGSILVVVIDKPEDLQVIFNSQDAIDKSFVYKFLLKNGLASDGGDLWRYHRKLLNPSFSPTIIKSFTPIFNKQSRILVKVLAKHLNKGEFDIYPPLSAFTLEALLSTIVGSDMDIQNYTNNWIFQCLEKATEVLNEKLFKIWLHFQPLYKFTKQYQKEKKYCHNGFFAFCDELLNEKELQYNPKITVKDEEKKPQIFIDQLLELKDHFTSDELKDELRTFLFAGHETSGRTIASILLMLAMHQDVQEKVVQELEYVFDSVDQETDNEMMKNLPYLNMVIKETLRLLPVIPILGREATKDVQLKSCIIPAGAQILLNMLSLHKNPKYWGNDAHLFNPDRFLPENISKIHPYAFVSFAKGPRTCIGMKYGMNVMNIILSHILRNYKVTTNLKFEDLEYTMELTLRIMQNCMIKLERREFK